MHDCSNPTRPTLKSIDIDYKSFCLSQTLSIQTETQYEITYYKSIETQRNCPSLIYIENGFIRITDFLTTETRYIET